MGRRGVACVLGAAAVIAVPAARASGVVYPVSAGLQLSREPPLASVVPPGAEAVYPGHIESREQVLVGFDRAGAVRALRVQQRLTVGGVGDYAFTVPGRIADVEALPGSGGQPGLRPSGIVWAGFSTGRTLLAAEARIRPAQGAAALPLQIRVERTASGAWLVVRNATAVDAQVRSGDVDPAALGRALDGARGALRAGGEPNTAVPVRGAIRADQVTVSARLAVEIQVGAPGQAPRTVRRVLGAAGGPAALTVGLPEGRPRVLVLATPLPSRDPLRPPGGAPDWETLARRLGPSATLRLATRLALIDNRTRQWQAFLANPDPLGRSTATYRYRLVAAAPVVTVRPASGRDGGHRTAVILVLVLLPLVAVGLAVVWAHA